MAQFQILVRDADGTLVAQDGYFDDGLTARPGDAGWSVEAVQAHCAALAKKLKSKADDVVFNYVCTPNWAPSPEQQLGLSAADVAVLADLALWQIEDAKGFVRWQRHAEARAEIAALSNVADDETKDKLARILDARLKALAIAPV